MTTLTLIPQPAFDEQEARQTSYDEFMGALYPDLAPGAFVGSLRSMFPVAMDGRDQQAFEEAYRDYPESDWYTMTHCAAFYQRVESAEDEELEDTEDEPETGKEDDLDRDDAGEANEFNAELLDEDEGDDESCGPFDESPRTFAGCYFVVAHGVGTSVSRDRFGDIEPSWELETDPGIFEFGFILKEPIANFACARALIDAMIDDGLCESDESGPWLFATCPPSEPEPESSANAQDAFFRRRLVSWRPELRYPTDDLIAGLGIQPRLTGIRYAGGDPIDHTVVLPRNRAN